MILLVLGIALCAIGAFTEIDGIRRLGESTDRNLRAAEMFNRAAETFNRAAELNRRTLEQRLKP